MPSKITVPATHVVARRSTDITAASDPHLVKALQFIRDHARENVMVAEVSRAAGLSRRALEIKFRREIGCSIRKHICRVRTDQIVRLLVETDLPVGQIAESLGIFRCPALCPLFSRRQAGQPAGVPQNVTEDAPVESMASF